MNKLTDKDPFNTPIEAILFLQWITTVAIFFAVLILMGKLGG